MPRTSRGEVFRAAEVGIYHCVNRCVRRAFLCGDDPLTGKSFDHRKKWIRERLRYLASQFGIDILGYAVMSNHMHVVLRNRPDVVSSWSKREVARRWWYLFPQRLDESERVPEPDDSDLNPLLTDENALAERRRRLSNISWFMRCLCERIARLANCEDECSGRFWQGRFACQSIEDESALLACSMYVDLNPIRAGVATTPETSEFTSAYDRIQTVRAQRSKKRGTRAERNTALDSWLSPLPIDGGTSVASEERASSTGFLPLSLSQYLAILDWTGRQLRGDKRGRIPDRLRPILERLHIVEQHWIGTVQNFGRWFRCAAGRSESLVSLATQRNRKWLHGVTHSRVAFA